MIRKMFKWSYEKSEEAAFIIFIMIIFCVLLTDLEEEWYGKNH